MKAQTILGILLALSALFGAVSGYFDAHRLREPLWWQVGSTLVFAAFIFLWYYLDSTLRSYEKRKKVSE